MSFTNILLILLIIIFFSLLTYSFINVKNKLIGYEVVKF